MITIKHQLNKIKIKFLVLKKIVRINKIFQFIKRLLYRLKNFDSIHQNKIIHHFLIINYTEIVDTF